MLVTSPLYPELLVTDLGLTFTDGRAEVDQTAADVLRRLPASLGLVFEGDRSEPETPEDADEPGDDADEAPAPAKPKAARARKPRAKAAESETW